MDKYSWVLLTRYIDGEFITRARLIELASLIQIIRTNKWEYIYPISFYEDRYGSSLPN